MTDFTSILRAHRRPRILIRAARAGVQEYKRDRDLKRVLRNVRTGSSAQTISSLLVEENRMESTRTSGGANYSIQRHVALLTAIIAEARLLTAGPATA